jgi:VanZ family protein
VSELSRRRWILVGAWVLVHLVLTSLPESALPALRLPLRADRLVHFGLGGVLGFLVAWAAGRVTPVRFVIAWLAVAVFAAFDEIHQPWFGRTAELMDWVMDVAGAAAGLGLGTLLTRSGKSDG